MITQIINFVNTPEFAAGIGIGGIFILLFSTLPKLITKKTFEVESFYNDIFSINQNLQNSQKENIEAKKKLDELYKIFKEVEGNLK
ncbi:hypothetical protein LCGC14_0979910 [marine sediment metagenome]|uniref:Uncharacterized protein n=1 Tax=marine sediment metagenome TaxID=412755 RepID=A0A0F9NDH7_9ZZZZ